MSKESQNLKPMCLVYMPNVMLKSKHGCHRESWRILTVSRGIGRSTTTQRVTPGNTKNTTNWHNMT